MAEQLQAKVEAFVKQYGLETGEAVRYMDLVSEVGELGKALLVGTRYGTAPIQKTQNLEEEVGDCLFSLLALSHSLKIDGALALEQVLEKYITRFSKKGDVGSGK